jgi:RNA polymerase sigma-70 factor (ECF subfamily)
MAGDRDVLAAMRGDEHAFARLYRRYARAVFVDLAARLRGSQDAEDALQATFLSAWANLPRLRRPRRFVAWLFRIARNKARDQLRRERPQLVLLGRSEDLIAPTGTQSPEAEALRALVSGLRAETRAIVLLRVLEGWSAEEVAAAQGLSVATVRRRYARAIQHLRSGLERSRSDDPQNRTSRRIEL